MPAVGSSLYFGTAAIRADNFREGKEEAGVEIRKNNLNLVYTQLSTSPDKT